MSGLLMKLHRMWDGSRDWMVDLSSAIAVTKHSITCYSLQKQSRVRLLSLTLWIRSQKKGLELSQGLCITMRWHGHVTLRMLPDSVRFSRSHSVRLPNGLTSTVCPEEIMSLANPTQTYIKNLRTDIAETVIGN